jgi:DNA-binding NtrC family response regulator
MIRVQLPWCASMSDGKPKHRVLVVDDDGASRRLLRAACAAEGYDVVVASNGQEGLVAATSSPPDVVLLDMQMPEMDGLAVLEQLHARAPELPVVMVTADRDVKSAVRATRLGAYDYLTKPIDHDDLFATVRRALEAGALRAELEALKHRLGDAGGLSARMGPSAEVREIIDQVRTVAASRFTVLVLGETGTGKELVAQAIHRESERSAGPFVALDCGAIPEALLESELFGHEKGAFTGADRRKEGRFEIAEGGTLFLDEIGNLPMSLQAKLLRVLESQQVASVGSRRARSMDVRFVAATNDDLQERAQTGLFRADLYFRLAQYTLRLPALRDRPSDVPYLASRFAEEAAIELRRPVGRVLPDALELLAKQPWPGNVRELRNVVRQAVLRTKDLALDKATFRSLLAPSGAVARRDAAAHAAGGSLREIADRAARDAETAAICATLRETKGNKSRAARALSTDFKTLHLKMKALGIRARDYAP